MKVLAIDTATDACSVALSVNGDTRCDHRVIPRLHARQLLPMIDGLMSEAGLRPQELDGLVFGQGPGSFTGVRIAAACVQGVALGAGLGVFGVSTLATIAGGCVREWNDSNIHVALDARMDEVYYGVYSLDTAGLLQCQVPDCVVRPEAIEPDTLALEPGAPVLAGSGVERYARIIRERLGQPAMPQRTGCLPHAQDLLTLGLAGVAASGWNPPERAVPVYLRNRVALTEAERSAGQRLGAA